MSHEHDIAAHEQSADESQLMANVLIEAHNAEIIDPLINDVEEVQTAYAEVLEVVKDGQEMADADIPFMEALSQAGEVTSGVPLVTSAMVAASSENLDIEGGEQALHETVSVNTAATQELQDIITKLHASDAPHEFSDNAAEVMAGEMNRQHEEIVDLIGSATALEHLIVAMESVEELTPTQAIIVGSTLDLIVPEDVRPQFGEIAAGNVSVEFLDKTKSFASKVWAAILRMIDGALQFIENLLRAFMSLFTADKKIVERLRARFNQLKDGIEPKRKSIILGADSLGLSTKPGMSLNIQTHVSSAKDIIDGLDVLNQFNSDSIGDFIPSLQQAFDELSALVDNKKLTAEELSAASDKIVRTVKVDRICPTGMQSIGKQRNLSDLASYDKIAISKPLPGCNYIVLAWKQHRIGERSATMAVAGFRAKTVSGFPGQSTAPFNTVKTFSKKEIGEILTGIEEVLDSFQKYTNSKLRSTLPASLKRLRNAVANRIGKDTENGAQVHQISLLANGYSSWVAQYSRFIMSINRSTFKHGSAVTAKMLAAYGGEHFTETSKYSKDGKRSTGSQAGIKTLASPST